MNQEDALKRWRETYQKPRKQAKNRQKKNRVAGLEKLYMEAILRETGWNWQKELKFLPDRKFRFDYACQEHKIAVEYEGIAGGKKSRHTTITGYTKDTEKYNLAANSGWRVLRYTVINFKDLRKDLEKVDEVLKKNRVHL